MGERSKFKRTQRGKPKETSAFSDIICSQWMNVDIFMCIVVMWAPGIEQMTHSFHTKEYFKTN